MNYNIKMNIEEAKECMNKRIPVTITGSYLFIGGQPTYITEVKENVSVENVKVEGSDDRYEIHRIKKYIAPEARESKHFEDDGAYADEI